MWWGKDLVALDLSMARPIDEYKDLKTLWDQNQLNGTASSQHICHLVHATLEELVTQLLFIIFFTGPYCVLEFC
jgi:hypothetical protein